MTLPITITRFQRVEGNYPTLGWCDIRIGPVHTYGWRVYRERVNIHVQRPPMVKVEDTELAAEIVRVVLNAYHAHLDAVEVLLGGGQP